MDARKYSFIAGVLGTHGANALRKAAERSTTLGNALLPRTILSWLGIYGRSDFEGELPGVPNTFLSFAKSEDGYSGSIRIDSHTYRFERASLFHVASAVAVALGAEDEQVDPSLKDLDLARLGKSIDLLAKAHVVNEAVLEKKMLDPKLGYSIQHEHSPDGAVTRVHAISADGSRVGSAMFAHKGGNIQPSMVVVDDKHQRRGLASAMYAHAEKATGKSVIPSAMQTDEGEALWQGNEKQKQFGKVELPGKTAAPRAAIGAAPPSAPVRNGGKGGIEMKPMEPVGPSAHKTGTTTAAAKPAKLPSLKLKLSESRVKCPVCSRAQFKDDRFVGCFCLKDLAKSTKVTVSEDGYVINFMAGWDSESLSVLLESLRKK